MVRAIARCRRRRRCVKCCCAPPSARSPNKHNNSSLPGRRGAEPLASIPSNIQSELPALDEEGARQREAYRAAADQTAAMPKAAG